MSRGQWHRHPVVATPLMRMNRFLMKSLGGGRFLLIDSVSVYGFGSALIHTMAIQQYGSFFQDHLSFISLISKHMRFIFLNFIARYSTINFGLIWDFFHKEDGNSVWLSVGNIHWSVPLQQVQCVCSLVLPTASGSSVTNQQGRSIKQKNGRALN